MNLSNSNSNSKRELNILNNKIGEISEFNQVEKDELDNYELNNLEYESAKKLDKRNFIKIYWSFLKLNIQLFLLL